MSGISYYVGLNLLFSLSVLLSEYLVIIVGAQ